MFIELRLIEVVVVVGELRFVIRIDGWGILPFGGGGGIDSGLSVECDGGGGGIIDWWHDGEEGLIDDGSDEFDCVEIITIWSVVFIDGELTMRDDWSVLYCCIAFNEWWYGGGGGGSDSGGDGVVGRTEGGDSWSFLFNDVSNDKDCWTNDDIDCWVTGNSDDIDWAEGAVVVTRFGGFAGGIRCDDDNDEDDDDDNDEDDDEDGDDGDDSGDDDDDNGDDDDDNDDDDDDDDFVADGYAGLGGLESFVV